MHIQPLYSDLSTSTLLDFIQENPLGIFTTGIASTTSPFLQSSHIPWVLDRFPISVSDKSSNPGRLRGHIAKQNPQCKAMIESLKTPERGHLESEVMILFNGPYNHYVTPKFYTETKPKTGKVAPTWNYAAVQVFGRARIYVDPRDEETGGFLDRQLADLSRLCERDVMGFTGDDGNEEPWRLEEAPRSYIDILKRNIVGIEILIDRIEGKFKMSQEKGKGDREGVIQGFERLGSEAGAYIARCVRERGEKKKKDAEEVTHWSEKI